MFILRRNAFAGNVVVTHNVLDSIESFHDFQKLKNTSWIDLFYNQFNSLNERFDHYFLIWLKFLSAWAVKK
jgi:hypothetical protein